MSLCWYTPLFYRFFPISVVFEISPVTHSESGTMLILHSIFVPFLEQYFTVFTQKMLCGHPYVLKIDRKSGEISFVLDLDACAMTMLFYLSQFNPQVTSGSVISEKAYRDINSTSIDPAFFVKMIN